MNLHQKFIGELLKESASLIASISDTPELDSRLLLTTSLGCSREWLISHSDESIDDTQLSTFNELLNRRIQGEPVAYLLGYKHFWNDCFRVTHDTLIPRPETELLIEIALDKFDHSPRLVADLGTGSGAIAVSLANERPQWDLLGIDLSEKALVIAKENGKDTPNLSWIRADWGDCLTPGSLDLLVCNPPYIAKGDEHLAQLDHEPRSALVSVDQGLGDLYRVISMARHLLKANAYLLLEHGYQQQQDVCAYLEANDFEPSCYCDLQGNPRAVFAQSRNKEHSVRKHPHE